MIGNNKKRYCLVKYVICTLMACGTLGLALLSAKEIEVIPPDTIFLNEGKEVPQGAPPADPQPGAEITHHGESVDYTGKAEYCLKCHETMVVKSHKILIKYPPPARGHEVTFRPLQEVQALGMKFEDGMITCISCHDLANQTQYHFALESRTGGHAQQLCYVCHLEIG